MISQQYKSRRRPNTLCYEDILLVVVSHVETGEDSLAIIHQVAQHNRADTKLKTWVIAYLPLFSYQT